MAIKTASVCKDLNKEQLGSLRYPFDEYWYEQGKLSQQNEIKKIIKWLKGSIWCNSHDTAWIEETIRKLKALLSKEFKPKEAEE